MLSLTSDKYRARDYIKDAIGQGAKDHLVPLIWAGKTAKEIPFDQLPEKYIIKPNNGCQRWIINNEGRFNVDKKDIDVKLSNKDIENYINNWFINIWGYERDEWLYTQIMPMIIIEELILNKHGMPPDDYRFCMFNGKCKLIYISHCRFENLSFSYYNENWNKLDIKRGKEGPYIPKPKSFNKMLNFAQILSKPFDFVRVDFLYNDIDFYFGELTHYPGSGLKKITPTEFDFQLGSYWNLNKKS